MHSCFPRDSIKCTHTIDDAKVELQDVFPLPKPVLRTFKIRTFLERLLTRLFLVNMKDNKASYENLQLR